MIKKNQIKKMFNQLIGYGFSQLVVILLPIILLPILTRVLTMNEFADYAIYKTILAISTPVISFSLSTFLLKNFFSEIKNKENLFLVNSTYFSFTLTIILILISYLFFSPIKEILNIDDFGIILFAYINTFLFSVYTLFLTVYRANSNVKQFLISNTLVVLITIFSILAISYFQYINLRLVLIAHSISYVIALIYGLLFNIRINKFDLNINGALIKNFVRFSIPIALYSLFMQLVAGNDRMIISFYLGKESLAVYASTFQIAFGVSAMGSVIQLAWSPYVFKRMNNTNKIDSQIFQYIFAIICFMTIFSAIYYALFPFLVNLFLPKEYLGGLNMSLWFILAGFIQVIYWMINPFLIIYEKRSYLLYIAIFTALISIVLNLLYTQYGMKNAAIIYFISWIFQCFTTILVVYYAQKNL